MIRAKAVCCSGQAMVELVVGLVAVLVLFAGLLQIIGLTQTQTDVLVNARREAGQRAMAGTANRMAPDYIRFWEEGPDESRHSVDDRHTAADPGRFRTTVIEELASDPSDWLVVDAVPGNPFSDLHDNANPISDFGLLNGTDSDTVDLIPTLRNLVYDSDTITVESEVWMPWMRGMY